MTQDAELEKQHGVAQVLYTRIKYRTRTFGKGENIEREFHDPLSAII